MDQYDESFGGEQFIELLNYSHRSRIPKTIGIMTSDRDTNIMLKNILLPAYYEEEDGFVCVPVRPIKDGDKKISPLELDTVLHKLSPFVPEIGYEHVVYDDNGVEAFEISFQETRVKDRVGVYSLFQEFKKCLSELTADSQSRKLRKSGEYLEYVLK